MAEFFLVFVPLFVAIDIPGLVPVFLGLTRELKKDERKTVIVQALATAMAISLLFITVGPLLFRWLGISNADFQIAGGLLLLVFAVIEMLQRGPRNMASNRGVGVVPLGTPLVVGPAVLSALLILVPAHGVMPALLALLANFILVGLALVYSQSLTRLIHENGLRATSQVINLFLAAIGVSLIRRGFETLLSR